MTDSSASLFAYGSLQLPEVFEAVTRLPRAGCPAVLRGFRRTKLKGFGFPAILADDSLETSGILYHSIENVGWQRLDAFEDDFYERKRVTIELADGGSCLAWTYVLAERFHHLCLDEPWSLDDLDSQTIRDLLARL